MVPGGYVSIRMVSCMSVTVVMEESKLNQL